jgi:hypothetical protein
MSDGEFSFFTAVAFTLNYIIGTGFLTLPWAFEKVGLIPSATLLGVMTVFACGSAVHVLETMARATTMRHLGMCSHPSSRSASYADGDIGEQKGMLSNSIAMQSYNSALDATTGADSGRTKPTLFRPFDVDEAGEVSDDQYLHLYAEHVGRRFAESRLPTRGAIEDGNKQMACHGSGGTAPYPLHRISGPKIEVTELCEIFLGKMGKGVYTALIGIYIYGTLAAYSTVFAHALSQRISLFSDGADKTVDYFVFLGLFTAVVTPLSCMELNEQVYIQVALSFCRVLMLVLMIGSVFFAESRCADTSFGHDQCVSFSDYDPTASKWEDTGVFSMNFDNMYIILPLIGYVSTTYPPVRLLLCNCSDLCVIVCNTGRRISSTTPSHL